jgi:type II secretory pathway component PulF
MNKSLQYIFKYLSVYISASLDISSSLGLICKRVKHKKLLKIFRIIQEKIKEGKSFKDSFTLLKDEKIIDGVTWSLISSAEYGGDIGGTCLSISKHMEEQSKTKSSLVGALAYPIGMFLASMCMVVFLITVAFPKITPLFKSMNAPIPITTQYMLNLSNFISNWGVYVFLVLFGILSVCVRLYYKEKIFKYKTQSFLLRIPILSRILLYREYINIASSVAVLLKNNKTLEEAMRVAIESCIFTPISLELETILENILSGQKISTAFDSRIFRDEWVDLIGVGEITGSLPQSFVDIGTLYESRFKDAVQVLVRSSEPIALCCTAIVVLIIALSVITPMYSIIQQVQTQ